MKYLSYHDKLSSYEELTLNSDNTPHVSYVEENDTVYFMPVLPKIEVGSIAYVDSSNNLKYCSPDDWESSLGTPVGVVAIPSNFLPDSPEMRLISIYSVDSAGTRNETGQTYSKWCSVATYDIPELDNYLSDGPCLDVDSNTITGSNGNCLCSDKFTTRPNPYDTGYGWNFTGKTIAPSPYKSDGSFNKQFIDNSFFPVDGLLNPLSDFNGKENTDILVGLGTAYTAANAARKYKAYDGDTLEWHLPSTGELAVYFHDFNKINAAITKAGGVQMSTDGTEQYWSSSEFSYNLAMIMSTYYGTLVYEYKYKNYYVRPFACVGASL